MNQNFVIIIPTYNRPLFLKRLLNDINNQTVKPYYIVIVDASESNMTKKVVDDTVEIQTKYINVDNGKYWTGSVNEGLSFVTSNLKSIDAVILLNDDTRIKEDYVECFAKLSLKHKNTLIGSANIDINDKSTILWAGNNTNNWFAFTKKYLVNQSIYDVNVHKVINSFTLIGRGLFIPIEVFDSIGFFDEIHFKHRGDTEFPLRAKNYGYQLIVSLLPVVYTYPAYTYQFEKGKLRLKDFPKVFFDFRSSSNIQTRYYYAKSATSNIFQCIIFFTFQMMAHFRRFFIRMLKH